ncbi:hypothetical protein OPV22_028967 [Ensete ventricosum]|uniref:Uncharacterized protein n=1 Tax=Ensete ventricosum TaxID=4639 RepID=A0AAV8QBZ7_ENSVE|nr:hypothetical protein OPV22_028967 [Ensete ventricosum]
MLQPFKRYVEIGRVALVTYVSEASSSLFLKTSNLVLILIQRLWSILLTWQRLRDEALSGKSWPSLKRQIERTGGLKVIQDMV